MGPRLDIGFQRGDDVGPMADVLVQKDRNQKKRPSVLSEARPSCALFVFKTLHEVQSSTAGGAGLDAFESELRIHGQRGTRIADGLVRCVLVDLLLRSRQHLFFPRVFYRPLWTVLLDTPFRAPWGAFSFSSAA